LRTAALLVESWSRIFVGGLSDDSATYGVAVSGPLPPERIGEAVKSALTVMRPKTRIAVTPSPIQDLMATTLPKRVVDAMIARGLGLKA
jgi:hypothetical protein